MVDWLAGKRVKGTSSERTASGFTSLPSATGGWVELDRTTLGSAGNTITVSGLTSKRYYMVLGDYQASGDIQTAKLSVNGDTTLGNYTYRGQDGSGGTDYYDTNHDGFVHGVAQSSTPQFAVGYFSNYTNKEKLMIAHGVGKEADGVVPKRRKTVGKWINTSNPITSFTATNAGTGNYDASSELIILGFDPDDTHTTNFWEELADVDLSSGDASSLSSGTITAKKYLWVQFLVEVDTLNSDCFIKFNNSSSNYAWRRSVDGGTDSTNSTGRTSIDPEGSLQTSQPMFVNMFIINRSDNHKLVIGNSMRTNGAVSNAPTRREWVAKWQNNSQITNISLTAQSGNFKSKTTMKIWGAD